MCVYMCKYKVNQAEYVIDIIAVAPQEYVNIYLTRRLLSACSPFLGRCPSTAPRRVVVAVAVAAAAAVVVVVVVGLTRARPNLSALTAPAQHITHSHSGIDVKRPTEKFVRLLPSSG